MTKMKDFFLDASALAKRYAKEPGTALVNDLFGKTERSQFIVFNIGLAEIVALLVRKKNAGRITDEACLHGIALLTSEFVDDARVAKLIADQPLVSSAFALIMKHSLNSTDAVILAACKDLDAGRHLTVLVSSDQRLIKAAQAEGLLTFDSEDNSPQELEALVQG